MKKLSIRIWNIKDLNQTRQTYQPSDRVRLGCGEFILGLPLKMRKNSSITKSAAIIYRESRKQEGLESNQF